MHNSGLDIDRIAFFGRTYAEYMDMFGLDESMLKQGPVFDCPAGASSFAAEAHQKGFDVTACDILYNLATDELMEKGKNDLQHVFEKFNEVNHLYVWKYYKDKNEVMTLRNKALEIFAGDCMNGLKEKRYIQAELPYLPFPDKTFSLVLSG
ncbi:MAG: class I SAM-dependent methyltransferase, partial [Nitrospirota bacterium]